jgi:2-haloalkanoic acid dehalogenase type II
MTSVRAVLFDFGGTLYDYATLASAEAESLVELARWSGVEAEPAVVLAAYREAMRRVFRKYLPLPFYLHRDMFRDAVVGMLEDLGAGAEDEHLERYRTARWERHARDFALREGVVETLDAIRRRGAHLGIVSNIDDDQLEHLLDVSRLADHFDAIISSESARACKPHPAIFEQALERAGCLPEETLFVGDALLQDIAGANEVGMRSVLLWHREDRQPADDRPHPRHIIRRIPDVLDLL